MNILKTIQSLLYRLKYFRIDPSKVVWLSLGENCLPDNILQRHGMKSFSTPYSHGRGNMDYALLLEYRQYEGLLDYKNLVYGYAENKKVVRSRLINICDDIYCDVHMNGFEFTHHDVIRSLSDRKSMIRKVNRLKNLKGKKDVVLLYHHRIHTKTNLDVLFQKAEKLRTYYAVNGKICHIVIFAQKIITDPSQRTVQYKEIDTYVHYFNFLTHHIWNGDNNDLFWGKADDDLIKKMIDTTREIIVEKTEKRDCFAT